MVGAMPPQLGGIERYVGDLIDSELQHLHHVIPFSLSKPLVNRKQSFKTLAGYKRSFGRGLVTVLASWFYSFFFFIKFLGVLILCQIDIIHIHSASYTSFWEKCYYIFMGKLFQKNIVLHIHGSRFKAFYTNRTRLIRRFIAYFMRKCDAVIALGRYWHRFYSGFVAEDKVKIVYNGIDLRPFEYNSNKADDPTLVFIGEVGKRKGIYDFIRAIDRLRQQEERLAVDIIGNGEIDRVKQIIEKQSLQDCVHLHGALYGRDKVDVLTRAWCFVLPSYAEQMPLVIIEAFAAGLPVVSTPVGSIPEMINPYENGFLIEPGNVDQMVSTISKLLNNKDMRQSMGRKNRQKAFGFYDINRCARDINAIYQSL